MRSSEKRQWLSLHRVLRCAFEQLCRASNACCDGDTIDEAKLKHQGGGVPIDMLAGNLAVLKSSYGDQQKFSSPAGRGYAGQHPIHLERVGEPHHVLCDDVLVSEDLRKRQELQVAGKTGQKLLGVKLAHGRSTRGSTP